MILFVLGLYLGFGLIISTTTWFEVKKQRPNGHMDWADVLMWFIYTTLWPLAILYAVFVWYKATRIG